MPDPSTLLAFAAAVLLLLLLPGPNVALIVANSVTHGSRFGLLTAAGTNSASVVQLFITSIGMAELLGEMGVWFGRLRWLGVAYLLWLGIAQWRAPAVDLLATPAPRASPRAIFGRAVLVSMTNPKTLLFYGAFFPQFIRPDRPIGPQAAVLSVMFLAMAVVVDAGWALLAGRLRGVLASRGQLRNRVSGGCLMGASAVLALARVR